MKNIYDDAKFFDAYKQMTRSKDGLKGAGEWHQLQRIFPDVKGKRMLDIGCGYGWHSKYAIEQGAASVVAFDLSEKMIEEAKVRNADPNITYFVCDMEEYTYPVNTYDLVISNLVLHYVADLDTIFKKVFDTLRDNGQFLFNIEHPTFTAGVNQDWIYNEESEPQVWPIDNYFYSGERETIFLGQRVRKQHHTLTQILMGLLNAGFQIEIVEEAQPSKEMMNLPEMKDEMRRPMMLLVRVKK